MTRLVNLYLVVTGGMAALVLVMPWLVVLGTFALVLPGLILGLSPTAFLWGLGFAIPWYLLRPMLGDYGAIVPAALVAAVIFWFAPQSSLSQSWARLAQSIRPEVLPPEKIRFRGHVLVDTYSLAVEKPVPGAPYDRAEAERRSYICDALCAALLATPGVESVTVNSHGRNEENGRSLTPHARTFRVVPKADCSGSSVRPASADQLNLDARRSARSIRDQLANPLQAEWDVRLSTKDCIVADAPRSDFDFIIRMNAYQNFAGDPPHRTHWSLEPLSVQVERLEVIDRSGRLLLSKTLASTRALAQPLHIAPEGGLESFHFQWGRKFLSNGARYEQMKPNQLLADHTNLRTEVDLATVMKATRDRLAQALADNTLPASDPAFKLAGPWQRSLDGRPMSEDDLALLAKVIRDPRITDYLGIWGAIKSAGDRAIELRGPMIDRIASLDLSMSNQPKQIGMALDSLPRHAFAALTETERRILAETERRALASGLISRQADRGVAAVPMLLEMLQFHLRELALQSSARRPQGSGAIVVVDRVRMAFCRLGPEASGALPVIDALASQGLIDRRLADGREWQLMLTRIGKPIGAIPKPSNLSGSEAQFHRNLQQRLERFRPDRDCRSQWS